MKFKFIQLSFYLLCLLHVNALDNNLSKDTLLNFIRQNQNELDLYNYYTFNKINNACGGCFEFDEQGFVNRLKVNQYPVYKMLERLKDSSFIVPEDCFTENANSISDNMTVLLRALYSDRYDFYNSRYIDDIYFGIKGDIGQKLNAYESIQLLKKYSLFKTDMQTRTKMLNFEKELINSILATNEFKNFPTSGYIPVMVNASLSISGNNSFNKETYKATENYSYLTQDDINLFIKTIPNRERTQTKMQEKMFKTLDFLKSINLYQILYNVKI